MLYDVAEPVTLTIKHNTMGGEIPIHDNLTWLSLSHWPLNIRHRWACHTHHWIQYDWGEKNHLMWHSPFHTIQRRKKFPFMMWLSLSHSPLNINSNGEGKQTYVTRLSLSEVTGGLLGRVMDSMSGASSWMVSPFTCTEMRAILGSWRWVRYTPSAVATVQCLQINNFTTFPSDNGVINTQPNYDWQNAIS